MQGAALAPCRGQGRGALAGEREARGGRAPVAPQAQKAHEPTTQNVKKNRARTVRLNRRFQRITFSKRQRKSPAQSTVNRCIADLIVQKSGAIFAQPPNLPQGRQQTRRQAGESAPTPPQNRQKPTKRIGYISATVLNLLLTFGGKMCIIIVRDFFRK